MIKFIPRQNFNSIRGINFSVFVFIGVIGSQPKAFTPPISMKLLCQNIKYQLHITIFYVSANLLLQFYLPIPPKNKNMIYGKRSHYWLTSMFKTTFIRRRLFMRSKARVFKTISIKNSINIVEMVNMTLAFVSCTRGRREKNDAGEYYCSNRTKL